ncbi:kinesin-like protein KIN-7L, chloroplastic, partial [Aphidius gifuensis]
MSDENVQVVVKMRPLIQREIKKCLPIQWAVDGNTIYQKDGKINYQFDNIFNIDSKNQDIFISTVQPIINEFLSGINCTILTYGQTSSGKTHTMIGSKTDTGLIPLIISHIFNFIENDLSRDYQLQFSYFELYNEKVIDLFDNNKNNKHLKIKEDKNGNVLIDCKQLVLKTTKEVLQKLKKVNNNRHVGETNMNEKSNRSHVLLRITIESCEIGDDSDGTIKTSQLTLVDLAGSENAKQAGGTNERRNEGRFINRSLSSLCSVINQLSDKNKKKTNDKIPFINYRDSKLTRLLQPSLGGNSKTMVICTVTPAALEETQSTLTFARRAKVIKNQPRINQEVTDKVIIKKLVKQMSELQEKIEQLKTQDVDKKLINKFPLKRRNSLIGNESVKELEQHFISKNKEILSSLKVKNNKCTSKLNYPLRRSTSMNISSSFKLEISNFEKELDEAEKE